ncbi:hypothetical protein H2199_003975 [Coniosporium tulheliwenetii]|uniref:Uncharacterized protein n=1 Tax=Coniosporium tulheliwenetii TaxID=3383036 RepID=A0ACC2Z8P3_9PEZI|nr:hypothetical protein H2199_003975 [Cladosporium sp. JES 115]
MATTAMTSAFRVPPGFNLLDNNHFYNGPPAAKPFQKKHVRKSRSNTLSRPFLDHGWTDIDIIIDEIDGTVLGPNVEPEAESVLTPTTKRAKTFGLLYSDGETDSEDDVRAQHEWEGGRPRDSGSPRAQGEELGDGNSTLLHRPTAVVKVKDPVMIADDTEPEAYPTSPEGLVSHGHDLEGTEAAVAQGSIELDQDRSGRLESVQSADKASTSDTGDGNQPETHDTISEADRGLASSEPNRVGSTDDWMIDSVTDSQAHSSGHENRLTAVEMIGDALAAPKHTHGDDRITSDQSSTENNKRKRCQTADTDDLGSQTPDTALERPLEDRLFNAQAGKQQIPRSSLSATVATVSSLQERRSKKLDDVNVKSLPSNLWLLTGIIHNSSDGANISSSNIAKPNHTHRDGEERTTRREVPARYDEEWSSDDSEHSSDSDLSEDDPNYDNEGLEDDEVHQSSRKHGRWSPADDERLIRWKKEGKEWKWIFQQFPGRTQASVRSRWYVTLRSKAESS